MTAKAKQLRRAVVAAASTAIVVLALQPDAGCAQDNSGTNTHPCSGTPDCQLQQQSPVTYGADATKGWAYYCTGDHPYFWGSAYSNNSGTWVQSNNCFTTTENGLAETGDPGKLDVTVTNWCGKQEDYVISLACSSQPPPYWQENCTATSQNVTHDPGCPQVPGSYQNISRTVGGVPVYFQLWEEQCSANLFWNCSADQGFIQCNSCSGKTN